MTKRKQRMLYRNNKKRIFLVALGVIGFLAYIQVSYATAAPCSAFKGLDSSTFDHAQQEMYVTCNPSK